MWRRFERFGNFDTWSYTLLNPAGLEGLRYCKVRW